MPNSSRESLAYDWSTVAASRNRCCTGRQQRIHPADKENGTESALWCPVFPCPLLLLLGFLPVARRGLRRPSNVVCVRMDVSDMEKATAKSAPRRCRVDGGSSTEKRRVRTVILGNSRVVSIGATSGACVGAENAPGKKREKMRKWVKEIMEAACRECSGRVPSTRAEIERRGEHYITSDRKQQGPLYATHVRVEIVQTRLLRVFLQLSYALMNLLRFHDSVEGGSSKPSHRCPVQWAGS